MNPFVIKKLMGNKATFVECYEVAKMAISRARAAANEKQYEAAIALYEQAAKQFDEVEMMVSTILK